MNFLFLTCTLAISILPSVLGTCELECDSHCGGLPNGSGLPVLLNVCCTSDGRVDDSAEPNTCLAAKSFHKCYCRCNDLTAIAVPALTECGACFSSHATADVEGEGKTRMSELKVGDYVLTGNGDYETIYSIDHRNAKESRSFTQIYYSGEEPLELTDQHMLFLKSNPNPVPAGTIKVGDYVETLGGSREVTKVKTIVRDGVYNPLTAGGTIVANGIISSTYSAFFGNNEWINIAGVNVISQQKFFSKALTPYKHFCSAFSSELCKTSNERATISWLAAQFYRHWTEQNRFYQALLLSFVIIPVIAMDSILSWHGFFLLASLVGCWSITEARKASKDKSN